MLIIPTTKMEAGDFRKKNKKVTKGDYKIRTRNLRTWVFRKS